MKKLAVSVALSLSLFADSNILLPYGGYIDYSGTTQRDNAFVVGLYGSTYKSPFKLELAVEHMRMTYTDDTPTYKQNSLAALAHFYRGYNWDFRFGTNLFFVNQGDRDETQKVFIAGATYYQAYDYNFAADLYYSDYNDFHVWQVSPKIGKTLGGRQSSQEYYYIEAGMDYISVSDNAAKQDNYITFNAKLQSFKGPWTTTIFGNVGKNSFRVAQTGFEVYNLGEEYRYSLGVSVARALGAKSSLRLSFTHASFYETRYFDTFGFMQKKFTETNNDVSSNAFIVSYTRSF